jgi:hypothetical protein
MCENTLRRYKIGEIELISLAVNEAETMIDKKIMRCLKILLFLV